MYDYDIEEYIGISYYKDEDGRFQIANVQKSYDILLEIKYESPIIGEYSDKLKRDKNNIIGEQFLDWLSDKLENLFGFLNYHCQKYIEKGKDGFIFLVFIQEIRNYFPLENETKRIILEWVETKKKELSQGSEKDKRAEVPTLKEFKTPPLNEFTKPVLTQVQISMLFKVMKEERVISNRDLTKQDYAKLIHYLTGYSENTLRQNFTSVQLKEISLRPQDYDQIIETLNSIIKKLNKAKGEIS